MKKNFLFFILLIFSACSTDNGTYKKSENINNLLEKNVPHPWSEIDSEGSDYALQNNETNSIFLLNSSCRKYEGSTLNALTNSLLTGLEDVKILEKKNVQYQNREAAEVSATGKLDGVSRYFKIVTLQKNSCIYDYVLITTNDKNLEIDSAALKIFLERIILN
ncbi:MAG: hypothetical protein WC635_16695 [Bacteriovorax sp.]|jgi:hypothetical protein